MRKRTFFKKTAAAVLAASMVLALAAGCGKGAENEDTGKVVDPPEQGTTEPDDNDTVEGFQHDPNLNEVGVEPIAKETVTLTIGLPQNSNVENLDTNHLTALLEEGANVDLEFEEYPSDEMVEKIRLMASGGGDDLPDILICGFDDATVSELAENEMIIPLDDYYENCSVYYKEGFERVKEQQGIDLYKMIETGDGHVYTIPTYNETLTSPAYARVWVYQPWLDAVGMKAEDIVTTEDFYDMLYAFKTQDPNGNGKADEIPVISTSLDSGSTSQGGAFFDFIMSAFVRSTGATNVNYINLDNGKVSVAYSQEAWKEGIKYVRSLCEEGLYDPSSFTTNADSFKTIMNSEGDQLVGCFGFQSPSFIVSTHPSKGHWTLLTPLTGPEGVCTTPYRADGPSNRAFITKNCEYPELAFRLLDLMGREDITISSRWGKEGENWNYVEDIKDDPEFADLDFSQTFAGYEAYVYEYNSCWNVLQNNHWMNNNPTFRTGEIAGGYYAASMANAQEGDHNAELAAKLPAYEAVKPAEVISKIKYPSDTQTEATEIENSLISYVREKTALWCTGAADVDAEWEDYLAELEKIGLSTYLELTQEAYDAMK